MHISALFSELIFNNFYLSRLQLRSIVVWICQKELFPLRLLVVVEPYLQCLSSTMNLYFQTITVATKEK